MNKKFKTIGKIIFVLAVIVIICILLMIPQVANKASELTGISAQKIKNTASAVVGIAIGLLFIHFGVAALAVPMVGIPLIVIGVVITGWFTYSSGWFGNSSGSIPIGTPGQLQKIA